MRSTTQSVRAGQVRGQITQPLPGRIHQQWSATVPDLDEGTQLDEVVEQHTSAVDELADDALQDIDQDEQGREDEDERDEEAEDHEVGEDDGSCSAEADAGE